MYEDNNKKPAEHIPLKVTPTLILAGIAALIAVIIIVVTIVAFATGSAVPGKYYRKADPSPAEVQKLQNKNAPKDAQVKAFTDIGTLRAVTKPVVSGKKTAAGTPLVVTPWFVYAEGDTALYEELMQKTRSIRAIITGYFGRYTQKELLSRGEDTIKAEILSEINENLVLGKITAIYFSDYLFLD